MPPTSTISGSTAAPAVVAGAAVTLSAGPVARYVLRAILGLATRFNPLLPDQFKRGGIPPDQAKVPPLNQKPLNDLLTNPPPLGSEQASGAGGRLDSTMQGSAGMDP